ncbi:hypothetical protein LHEJCM20397_08200 [Lactobacillus helveticus]|nr:hypothetical protein LHEJCM1006_07080 [Lactobacillus helveticus]GFP17272.1 hypothetical protein LHEJCM20397_08200 [Lactobacillus helveticus]GIP66560.1 hypothetical protein LhelvAHU1049_07650 [Lactobacillus helveticus]
MHVIEKIKPKIAPTNAPNHGVAAQKSWAKVRLKIMEVKAPTLMMSSRPILTTQEFSLYTPPKDARINGAEYTKVEETINARRDVRFIVLVLLFVI